MLYTKWWAKSDTNFHIILNVSPTWTHSVLTSSLYCVLSGSGIGTGPGVIQDRYSPTMGRHRTNPLFNGHSGHIAPPPQSQFDMGPKSFVKSNQVTLLTLEIDISQANSDWCFSLNPEVTLKRKVILYAHVTFDRFRTSISSTRTRTIWPNSRSSPRTCLHDSARKDSSMQMR